MNAISAPRNGSMAKKPMSATPPVTASTDFVAAGKVTSASGTPSRSASARARSTETPRGAPVSGSVPARIGLPRLMEARRRPVGASSATVAASGWNRVLIGTFSIASGGDPSSY